MMCFAVPAVVLEEHVCLEAVDQAMADLPPVIAKKPVRWESAMPVNQPAKPGPYVVGFSPMMLSDFLPGALKPKVSTAAGGSATGSKPQEGKCKRGSARNSVVNHRPVTRRMTAQKGGSGGSTPPERPSTAVIPRAHYEPKQKRSRESTGSSDDDAVLASMPKRPVPPIPTTPTRNRFAPLARVPAEEVQKSPKQVNCPSVKSFQILVFG